MKKQLQLLLSRNDEAQEAYHIAASAAQNKNFKSFLSAYADKRKTFAKDIKTYLVHQGISVGPTASFAGSIRKAFMQLRVALPGTRDKMLLKECARFESRNLADYEEILHKDELPNELSEMLLRQRDAILTAETVLSDIARLLKSDQISSSSHQ